MRYNIFLFLSILTLVTSCNGHSPKQSNYTIKKEEQFVKGDTVKELSNNIMVVYQDTKNNYWFGSWNEGLYKYDGKIILHFTKKNSFHNDRVEDIKEDKLGNLYFNTSEGIIKYDGKHFEKLTETLADDSEWSLNSDDIWFKSSEHTGYVFRYDGNTLYRLKLPKTKLGEDYLLKHPNYPNPYGIYSVYKDSKGNIWFGTAVLGACRYNGKSFDWISEQDVTELHDGPANGVRSIAEDNNGYFWFNTEYRYNINRENVSEKSYKDKQQFYNRIKSIGSLGNNKYGILNEYLSIIKDNNKDLWIVTYDKGVWKYDGVKTTHYPVQINNKDITLFSIYKDNNGCLWLGTHENGAFKFNGKTFEKFTL